MRNEGGKGANGSPRKSAVGLVPLCGLASRVCLGLSGLLGPNRQVILKLLEKKVHVNTHNTELTTVTQRLSKMLQ